MARNPKIDEAKELYHKGFKLIEIANKLDIPEGTIRSWKNRYKWNDNNATLQDNKKSKCNVPKEKNSTSTKNKKKPKIDKETALVIDELTEKQRLFAEEFVRVPIAYKAAIKAGYSSNSAFAEASRLLRNVKIKSYINYLKELKRESILIGQEDLVDVHMRIAFSDITDYVEFGKEKVPIIIKGEPLLKENPLTGEKEPLTKLVNALYLKEDFDVDGSLISEISSSKDGVKIKFYDKQKSLEWLTNFFEFNPTDKHKQKYDNAKLELEKQKFELEKQKQEAEIKGLDDTDTGNLNELTDMIKKSAEILQKKQEGEE